MTNLHKRMLPDQRIGLATSLIPVGRTSNQATRNGCKSLYFRMSLITMWAASSEFGTYRLCEQRRFRRVCASARSRQNRRCSLIQAESRKTFRQKPRYLAPLNGWACTVKICHDGILEDTNSLEAAHMISD